MTFSRRTFVIGAVVLVFVLTCILALPWLSPKWGAQRVCDNFFDAFEVNDNDTIAELVSPEYEDKWGLNRDEALELARLLRLQIIACTVSRHENKVELTEDDTRVTLVFTIRLQGKGRGAVDEWLRISSSVPTENTFTLKRVSWKPWDWQITRIDNTQVRSIRGYKAQLERMAEKIK